MDIKMCIPYHLYISLNTEHWTLYAVHCTHWYNIVSYESRHMWNREQWTVKTLRISIFVYTVYSYLTLRSTVKLLDCFRLMNERQIKFAFFVVYCDIVESLFVDKALIISNHTLYFLIKLTVWLSTKYYKLPFVVKKVIFFIIGLTYILSLECWFHFYAWFQLSFSIKLQSVYFRLLSVWIWFSFNRNSSVEGNASR